MLNRVVAAAILVLCLSMPATADVEMQGIAPGELFPWASFASGIPTQKEVVGFDPGARPLTHGEAMRYLEALAASSPRAMLRPYARTHEGRELVTFFVSDEQTIAGLEEFREAHLRRVDPRLRSAAEDAAALDGARAVAWIAYGIHGDELSSVDAAAALAYWLVAGEDERARNLRGRLVIIIDPAENPDGRDRYLAQTRSFAHKVPNPDQDDLSHTGFWPQGRGNHYLFDLNRDWFSMVHPESARSGVIAGWEPQLMVDSHEMGDDDTYLFSPPRHPFNPHLPASHLKWWDRFAGEQASALDARGYPYYTREWNEEFFPGYGSSWAAYRGALGILYEMSGTAGTLVRKHSGDLRTYAEATEHHVLSSIANLESLSTNRSEVLADFVADRREVVEHPGGVAAWVLPEGRNPQRTRDLVRLLRRQGIEVLGRDGGRLRLGDLRDGRSGAAVSTTDLPPNVWLVPVRQPAGRLVRELLDPHIPMNADYFREERRSIERGEGSRLYETTGWSLPFNFGIDAYWTADGKYEGFSLDVEAAEPAGGVRGETGVAWLIDGTPDRAVGALADLLQRGIRVRVARKPFSVGGQAYDRGALLVRVEGNPADLEQTLSSVAERWKVTIDAASSGRAESGPDLGGEYFPTLVAPRVGVWTGPGISSSQYGEIWHLLDEVVELRFSGIDVARAGRTDLRRYNVLIFPSGSYGALGDSGLERIKAWIEGGGTAIGIGGGAEFLAAKSQGISRARLRREALEEFPPVVYGPSAETAAAAGLFRATGMRAPKPWKDGEDGESSGDGSPTGSPYDVAPMLGPGAAPFAAGHPQGTPVTDPPVELGEWLKTLLPSGKSKPDEETLSAADERLRSLMPSRGAHLRVELDPELWLSWGAPSDLPVLARTDGALVAAPPVQVPARFAPLERLHLGGLLWPEGAGRLAETAYATRESVGRGQVILFLNDPEFRAWTIGTRRLLTNAILYGPGLGSSWSTPW
jgi:hypothetical protein